MKTDFSTIIISCIHFDLAAVIVSKTNSKNYTQHFVLKKRKIRIVFGKVKKESVVTQTAGNDNPLFPAI